MLAHTAQYGRNRAVPAPLTFYAPPSLNYVSLDLPADETQPQADCPRPSERRDWAAFWNGDEDGVGAASEEAVTSYSTTGGATWHDPVTGAQEAGTLAQQTSPDGTVYKEYSHASGWDEGLVRLSEVWSVGTRRKWAGTSWTQDNETLAYEQNSRARETNVYDSNSDGSVRSRRRTEVTYTSFGLPEDVREYDSNATTVLRRTRTEYVSGSVNAGGVYTSRRLIGLPLKREVFGRESGQEKLFSKVTFEYDLGGEFLAAPGIDPAAVTQHDEANFGAGFNVRGNLCRKRRWDAGDQNNQSKSVATEAGYNTLGSVVFKRDALGHQAGVSYADSNGGTRLAYPTTITDSGGFTATTRYNYDMGAVAGSRTPQPNLTTNQPGPEVARLYDSVGRALKVKVGTQGAYTRWEYGANGLYIRRAMAVDAGQPETSALTVTDGAGRVRGTLRELPGGYSARRFENDKFGRQVRQYKPVRVSVGTSDLSNIAGWQPAFEDAPSNGGTGWVYASNEYDWKSRPVLISSVGSPATTKEFSYDGCGCAGGEVALTRDETGRRRKVTLDILGRVVKVQDLDEQGKGLPLTDVGAIYRTVLNTYNTLDQITETQSFAGAAESDPTKIVKSTSVYDGHSRLLSNHSPGQAASGATVFTYHADDTVESVTDARGVKVSYGYNLRHLLESVVYDLSGVLQGQEVAQTPNAAFTYDAAGNRLSMSAGASGSVSYTYTALSQLASEARQFPGLSGTYTLSYEYTLSGQLKSVTDQTNSSSPVGFSYEFDAAGQMKGVTSTGMGASAPLASNAEYRAWGALKQVEYGDTTAVGLSYDARGLVTGYALSGAKEAQTGAARSEGGDFQYYADGRVKYATDHLSRSRGTALLDRAYAFDLVGRLKEAYSGADARVFVGDVTPGSADVPYRQSYTFDAWDNQRDRTGHYWGREDSAPVGFDPTTGRDPAWEHDADGRLVSMNEPSPNGLTYQPARFKFDAAGRRAQTTQTTSRQLQTPSNSIQTTAVTVTDTFDGDGLGVMRLKVSQVNSNSPVTSSVYYLRSSVLGGRLIAEYGASGARQASYAYAGGEVLAVQQGAGTATPSLRWQHLNPVTGDARETDSTGKVRGETHLDPGGADVGVSDPFASSASGASGGIADGMSQAAVDARAAQLLPGYGGPKCMVDFAVTSCALANGVAESGAGVIVDSDTPGGKFIKFRNNDTGQTTYRWAPLTAVGDRLLYLPLGAYIGNVDGPTFTINLREIAPAGTNPIWTASLNKLPGSSSGQDQNVRFPSGPNRHWAEKAFDIWRKQLAAREREQEALNRAYQMLTGRCATFIEQVLRKAAEKTGQLSALSGPDGIQFNFSANSSLIAYQAAMNRGEVRSLDERPQFNMPAGAEGATTRHSRGDPNDPLMFMGRTVTWRDSFYNLDLQDAARQTLHESMHQFEDFTDAVLANAAQSAAGEKQVSYGTSASEVSRASTDLNTLLRRFCP